MAMLYCLAHVVATAGAMKNESERAAKRRVVVVERAMACLDDWRALQRL